MGFAGSYTPKANNNTSYLTHPTDENVQSVTTRKKSKKSAKQIPSGIWK
jgi:hypothetical protein